jgi:ABC-type hemin transport system substrate-binding protein
LALRVVSLVPSITETLLAWGIEPVACTRFCEQPRIAHVGGTKDPDLAAIVALRPDLVLMDVEENRKPDAETLAAAGVKVHATHVQNLAGLATQLELLARAVGVAPVGLDLAPSGGASKGSVAVLIWKRPWMALGSPTYGSSVLEWLGWSNALAGLGAYPTVELAQIAQARPDLVLLPSEPYPFAERHAVALQAELGSPCVVVDGQDLLWWGARTPEALRRLHDRIAPRG